MARIAPLPVVLNRRLNEEYPFAGPPASDGGFPYARTCATGAPVPVPVPVPPTRGCCWRDDHRPKIEAVPKDDDEAKDDDARRLRPTNRDNNDNDDVDDDIQGRTYGTIGMK